MIWIAALVLGLLAGLATGGRIDNFAQLRFRWPVVVVAAVVIREAVLLTPLNEIDGAQYIYVVFLAIIVLWTIWHFRRLPGIWLVTAGGALNMVVMLANSARMPVTEALAGSLVQRGHIGQYVLMGPGTHLRVLADWIALWPIPEVYSPGDLLIAAGLAATAFLGTRPTSSTRTAHG